jgi:hypothetical protein
MAAKNKQSPRSKTAVDAPRLNAYAVDPYEIIIVGRDTSDGPEHPLWDERAKKTPKPAFVRDIARRGVKLAVQCKKIAGRLYCVDGRQRTIGARMAMDAAKAAGNPIQIRVPVMLIRGSDEDVEGDMIALNEHRVDDDPLTKARKALRYIGHGHTEQEAAEAFGVSRSRMKELLTLAESPKALRDAVESGEASAAAAIEATKLPREKQVSAAKGKRGRGRPAGPSKPKVEEALARALIAEEPPHPEFLRALQWVLGKITDSAAGMNNHVVTPVPARGRK